MLCPKGSLAIPRLCHWISKTMPLDLPHCATGSPRLCHWISQMQLGFWIPQSMPLGLQDYVMPLDLPEYATGSPRLCHWISKTVTGSPRL